MAESDSEKGSVISPAISDVDVINILRLGIGSIKASVEHDGPWRRLVDSDRLVNETWKSALLRLEDIRIELSSARPYAHHLYSQQTDSRNKRLLRALFNAERVLSEFASDSAFRRAAEHTRFRTMAPDRLTRYYAGVSTVEHAVVRTLELVKAIRISRRTKNPNNIRTLRELVPPQKVSPVQFSVHSGKLVVVCQSPHVEQDDAANVRDSRDALLSKGNKLVEELQRSNCDRRLLQSVAELQENLGSCGNVIQLGLINVGVDAMCSAFGAELSDALKGMLLGHTRGVAMYVAQFPEWQRFSEKAAAIELSIEDISRISETAKRLIGDLEQHPEVADDEVPRTIKALQKLIDDPRLATKRAAFAVLRTIENLVAKVFEYCTDFLEETAAKTVHLLSEVTSRTVVICLMTLALTGALGISPLSAKIADTSWLRAAAEIVEQQIENLSK